MAEEPGGAIRHGLARAGRVLAVVVVALVGAWAGLYVGARTTAIVGPFETADLGGRHHVHDHHEPYRSVSSVQAPASRRREDAGVLIPSRMTTAAARPGS